MNRRAYLGGAVLILIVVVGVIAAGQPAQQKTAPQAVVGEDRIVAGGPKDLMEVRHLVLNGSNEEIGYALAKIAAERFQVKPLPAPDRFRSRHRQLAGLPGCLIRPRCSPVAHPR